MSTSEMPSPTTQPEVRGGVVPYLTSRDAGAAADFYVKAFGATVVQRMPPDDKGRHMHIHLYVNGGSLMLSDAFPEHGHALQDPAGYTLHLAVDDVDAWWRRAVDAGATVTMPLADMFWGDRYGQLRDPFGVSWSMGAPIRR